MFLINKKKDQFVSANRKEARAQRRTNGCEQCAQVGVRFAQRDRESVQDQWVGHKPVGVQRDQSDHLVGLIGCGQRAVRFQAQVVQN